MARWRWGLIMVLAYTVSNAGARPCCIEVTEEGTGWPVPLVALRTTHNLHFVTDNAGRIAIDAPDMMGIPTWFTVTGQGYEVPKDSFGYHGVRLTPTPGATLRITVRRTVIARRLGRVTGGGLFAESQKLGLETDWRESGVWGCDSVQNAVHRGRVFWLWGDTTLPHDPLGIFHATSATTPIRPLERFEPPLRMPLESIADDETGRPRPVAKMPGSGPTWLTAYVSLPDPHGTDRLVATYAKIKPPLEAYEYGLCIWNDDASRFERHAVLWSKSEDNAKPPPLPKGHPAFWTDDAGKRWVLFGDPFPTLRCPATFAAWGNRSTWEPVAAQERLQAAAGDRQITPHSGHIAWSGFRERWVTVFMERFGTPSAFGELWYAEADSPAGPWGKAVKILSHDNYSFYNPRLHPEFTAPDSPILIFEGTFTKQFAERPEPTPRYDYNQILYRLDLDDPRLSPARGSVPRHAAEAKPAPKTP